MKAGLRTYKKKIPIKCVRWNDPGSCIMAGKIIR
jgi:hypothetical protein